MASATRPSRLPWWAEGIVLFVAYQGYEYVRSLITGSQSAADRNARTVVRLERDTWLWHEQAIQRSVIHHHFFVEGLDLFYGTVHFIVPPLVLVWLWRRLPERYADWRNTLIVATLLGLACFWLYPLTPPRLLPASYRFVDTMRQFGGLGPLDSGKFKDLNPYAAMPSLHLAWSTWCALAVASGARRPWAKFVVFAYPATVLFVVVATANHYLLDAVGGWVVLGLAWCICRCAHRVVGEGAGRGGRRSALSASPGMSEMSEVPSARRQPTIP